MSDSKRYLAALLIGWGVGGCFYVFLHMSGLNSEAWAAPVAFVLTFTVTTFAIGLLP